MAYYTPCPFCNSNLDPGESCDCIREQKERDELYSKSLKKIDEGQLAFVLCNVEE